MRRREISPEFWTDEKVVETSDAAKLLFIGLWNLADREGRLEDKPRTIGFKVRPWAPTEVADLLVELHKAGLIDRYECDGVAVVSIPHFNEHQRPHPKEVPSKLPKAGTSREISRLAVESSGEPGKAGTDRAGSSGSSFPSGPSGSSGSAGPSAAPQPPPPPAQPVIAAFEIEKPDIEAIDGWSKEAFWRAAELTRREAGFPPERWPSPVALSRWWAEARQVADTRDLASAFVRFTQDAHWRAASPPCPWAAFAKQYLNFLKGAPQC